MGFLFRSIYIYQCRPHPLDCRFEEEMVEPISVIGSVGTLMGVSYRLITGVNALVTRYQHAKFTLTTLATECSMTKIALTNIQRLLHTRPDFLSEFPEEVDARGCLQTAIETWVSIFSILDSELARINRGQTTSLIIRLGGTMRYLLNEDTLRQLSKQLQDLRSSISFLLDSAHT